MLVQLADVGAPRDKSLARARVKRRFSILGRIVLVQDLAHDLLEQIFHSDDAGGAAVLVQHHSHVLLESLEIGEHFLDFARAGNHVHRPHDRR